MSSYFPLIQLDLLPTELDASSIVVPSIARFVAMTEDVAALLEKNSVVAVGVSGGKDSDACAIAVDAYLNQIGHTGQRVLIHADLGRVEWKDSLPSCERLAKRLGWELMVVKRNAGDMLARWQGRWANNLTRYQDLSCVKVILPWSTPSMRFCTSELKVAVITSALKKRYPGQDIINVAGIRRQESPARNRMPISAPMASLTRRGNVGVSWNAIIEWKIEEVFDTIAGAGLRLHEAYTKYGASRVSCAYCIMSTEADLRAAAGCEDNQDVYRSMVELEADSTFAFQGNRWLADVAPSLLSDELIARIHQAKLAGIVRQQAESRIPEHLLYAKGWPTCVPTLDEARLLAEVRRDVSNALGLAPTFINPHEIQDRYEILLSEKSAKDALKAA